jgi:hypothetical protein
VADAGERILVEPTRDVDDGAWDGRDWNSVPSGAVHMAELTAMMGEQSGDAFWRGEAISGAGGSPLMRYQRCAAARPLSGAPTPADFTAAM